MLDNDNNLMTAPWNKQRLADQNAPERIIEWNKREVLRSEEGYVQYNEKNQWNTYLISKYLICSPAVITCSIYASM